MSALPFADWLNAAPDTGLAEALAGRASVFEMIDDARAAVLSPEAPGGISTELRHALAARVARQTGAEALADAYLAARPGAPLDVADPSATPEAQAALLTFVDRVGAKTREVESADITALRDAGVAEPDIVRLCELVAFVAFQARVAALVALMEAPQ